MTAVIIDLDSRRRRRWFIALTVDCPYCHAIRGARCTNRGTSQVRLGGPHPDRTAAAEAELERNQDA